MVCYNIGMSDHLDDVNIGNIQPEIEQKWRDISRRLIDEQYAADAGINASVPARPAPDIIPAPPVDITARFEEPDNTERPDLTTKPLPPSQT